MPMPIMPKRTRSLAATALGSGRSGDGSGPSGFPASDAPAAAALRPTNSRREKVCVFTASPWVT